jgi:hypothetical protein
MAEVLPCNSRHCREMQGVPRDKNGDRLIDKFTGTLLIEVGEDRRDVFCLDCLNWIGGEKAIFGDIEQLEEVEACQK